MALALIWPADAGSDASTLRLRFDLGHNRYYMWQLGDEERIRTNGVARIANVQQRSRLFGPLADSARGRGVLELPRESVSRKVRFAQLLSFRTEDGVGPAVSPIVELDWAASAADTDARPLADDLPPPASFALAAKPVLTQARTTKGAETAARMALTMAKVVDEPATDMTEGGTPMTTAPRESPQGTAGARVLPVDAAPLRWRERDLSQGMFLQGLLAALPSFLPQLAPLIGGVLNRAAPAVGRIVGGLVPAAPGLPGGAASGGAAAGAVAGGAGPGMIGSANPQLAQLIEQLLRSAGPTPREALGADLVNKISAAIGGGAGAGSTAGAPLPAAKAFAVKGGRVTGSMGARVAACAPRRYARSQAAALRLRRSPARAMATTPAQGAHSQAMVAPALLAALPALMPLLQQVMSPQNIQTLVDAPQRATGQIINGVLDFAKLGMQATEAEREHLRKLNPGVDNPALDQLLLSMGQGLASARRLNYRRAASVKLSFDGVQSQVLFGRSRVLYRTGMALQFPLSVSTPQTIADTRLVLQFKHPDTLAVLLEETEEVGELSSGPVPVVPRVDEQQLAKLEPNQDYLVVATLLWKNRRKQAMGTSMQQRITLVGEYAFDRVEESGEPVAASDFDRHRDLWHKVWQGDFATGAHVARLDCRYYLVLNPKRTNNARLDTHVEGDGEGGLGGRLRTGMEYSPYVLNHLLSRLSPGSTPLGDAQLEALAGADFVERFNQAAQFNGKLKGRRGEQAALWTYPEFKIQTLVLTHAEDVDENGNVHTLGESRVKFPMPVMLHFVGVKSA